MTYATEIKHIGVGLCEVIVKVMDGADVILEGKTLVGTDDEELAQQYIDEIFVPDLRRNQPLCDSWPMG